MSLARPPGVTRAPGSGAPDDVRTPPGTDVRPAPPAVRGPGPRWRRGWLRLPDGLRTSLVIYLATSAITAAGVAVHQRLDPVVPLPRLATKWDGWWYLTLAERGYSSSLRSPATGLRDWHHAYSGWAFFPGYPLAIRAVHFLTRSPFVVTAVALSALFGLLAVWAVHALGEEFGGRDVGRTAALLVATWPGAAVFLQPYSEALFLAATAAALLALLRERWVLAGLLGAVAAGTRPTGIALVAAAGAVAAVRLVRRHDPRALAAPLIMAAAPAAFAAHAWRRTGDALAWRHAENLWSQRLDLSKKLLGTWWRIARHPGGYLHTAGGREVLAGSLLQVGGALALVVMLVAVVRLRRHLSLPLAVYAAVSLALVLSYSAVGPRPRTLLAVVPAFVWVAAAFPHRRVRRVAVATAPLLAVVTFLWLWRVTP